MLDSARQSSIRPRSTATSVYELLRNDIVVGTLKPQQPIREAEIAERLSVSRTPVREALLRLSNLGLVDIFPQSGTIVAPIRMEKVRAAQLIREAVEVEVVRRACQVATSSDIDALNSILDEQDFAMSRRDVRRFYEIDETFHDRIFEVAGCAAVISELSDIKTHLNRLRFVSLGKPANTELRAQEHRAIVASLASQDEEMAALTMSQHLRALLHDFDEISDVTNKLRSAG